VSGPVICHGCGQALAVPAGYQRRKMRCPQCGVICELPDPGKAPPPAAKPGRRPTPPPAADPEAAAEEVLFQREQSTRCPQCGEELADSLRGRKWCPRCAPPTGIKPAAEQVGVRPVSRRASPEPATSEVTAFDDTEAYGVVGGPEEPKCPGCGKPLPAETEVCPACGFNRTTGKKPPKVYEPVERHWDAGMSLRARVTLLIVLQAVIIPLGGACAVLTENVPVFAITWLVGAVMLAFLLGTYDRVDLEMNKKGRIRLTKTWRVCFVPQTTTTIRVSEYEGIVSSRLREVNLLDWVICLVVMPAGVIPSVIWWWYAIYHDSYQVALARDHGYPEMVLYRGWSEAHMREIAQTLRDVAELPWEGG
jgi:hypothetical protein